MCSAYAKIDPSHSILHVWEPRYVREAGGNYPFYFWITKDVISLAGGPLLRSR